LPWISNLLFWHEVARIQTIPSQRWLGDAAPAIGFGGAVGELWQDGLPLLLKMALWWRQGFRCIRKQRGKAVKRHDGCRRKSDRTATALLLFSRMPYKKV